MKKIVFLLLALLMKEASANTQDTTGRHPNVILIFMDDMGYGDLSVNGALGYTTPTLDRLASQGIRFTNFLAAQATCTASRAALLTGNYPNRMGMYGAFSPNAGVGLRSEEITVAEMLKSKNYQTHMIGKWHLGNEPQFLPTRQGFDTYFGLPYSNDMWPVEFDGTPAKPGGRVAHYPPLPLLSSNHQMSEPDTVLIVETLKEQAKLTTLYTENAVDYIRAAKDGPFFLYLAHSMPHAPIAVSSKFEGKSEQGLFGDMMMEIDWSVEQIQNVLEESGIADNTLLIFTSDNGPWLNFGNHNGSTSGFREGKGNSWEGGVRVPCLVSWPAAIREGKVVNQLASTLDVFATLAELVGYTDHPYGTDGISFLSVLLGEEQDPVREEFYYYYNKNDLQAVRWKHWKLVFPHTYRSYRGVLPGDDGEGGAYAVGKVEKMELYDLRRDPGEDYDVLEKYPEIKNKMLKIADRAREDLGDNLQNKEGKNRRPIGMLAD